MNTDITTLQPLPIWKHFAALNQVPRPSKKEEKVIQFIIDFAKKHNLTYKTDAVGNVLITKDKHQNSTSNQTIVLQSHLDMVCQKNNDTVFDFDTQGIDMYIDGDFVKAKGTTLGADNGIGVATMMAILESTDVVHPALECLFTIDEETGMTGAKNLSVDWLTGSYLLNLDTEEDDELDIGCAGGIDITAEKSFDLQEVRGKLIQLNVKGLTGGHSGMDIHKGRGNANKLITRLLYALKDFDIQLISIDGGGLRNAIPREAHLVFSIETSQYEQALVVLETAQQDIKTEYQTIEPTLSITWENTTLSTQGLSKSDSQQLIQTLQALHNGVFRWSPDIEDLVETSNNLARVELETGNAKVLCLTRSSIESGKKDLVNTLTSVLELGGFTVTTSGDYPGWKPNPHSTLIEILSDTYQQLFTQKPRVLACHAGLECGIIGSKYPQMEMISFGPNIFGAHSPDEKVSISSVQKFWTFVLEVLKKL